MGNVLAVALGGACGALCRYAVGLLCRRWLSIHFAAGTLLVNVAGCFLLGMLLPLCLAGTTRMSPALQAGLGVGFLGALTTFSTFGVETYLFYEQSRPAAAVANVVLNVAGGLLAVVAGVALGARLTA